jgi:hypothetical protein
MARTYRSEPTLTPDELQAVRSFLDAALYSVELATSADAAECTADALAYYDEAASIVALKAVSL